MWGQQQFVPNAAENAMELQIAWSCSSSWTYMFLRLFTKHIETKRPLIVPSIAFKHSTLLEAPWWLCRGSGGEGRRGGGGGAGKGPWQERRRREERREEEGERWVVATAHARNFQMCQPEFNLEPQKPPFPFPLLLRLLPFPFSLIFFSAAAQTMQKERDFSIFFSVCPSPFCMGVCVWALDLLCLHVGFSCQRTFVKKKRRGRGESQNFFRLAIVGMVGCRNNQTTAGQKEVNN